MNEATHAPIGVFDSGIGGLTVLRALHERLPQASTIYLGDTARVPYGTKSGESVIRYAVQAAEHLVDRGIGLLVVACNTASALALDALSERFPVPVVGVVEPGAAAAVAAAADRTGGPTSSQTPGPRESGENPGRAGPRRHLVLATESTVEGGAYTRAIRALSADAEVEEIPCTLLVALAEEGWTDGPVATATLRRYLEPVLTRPPAERPHTVVLGCTHFPLLRAAVRDVLGPGPRIVDSARTVAEAVADLVETPSSARPALAHRTDLPDRTDPSPRSTAHLVLTTDGPCRFARVGSRFLGRILDPDEIEVVDL